MALAQGRRTFGDTRPFYEALAEYVQDQVAVPRHVILTSLHEHGINDPSALADAFSAWLIYATPLDRVTEICEALLARTESATCTDSWSQYYATEVARVFRVSRNVGLDAFQTPGQQGRRWSRLVSEATAAHLLPSHSRAA